MNAQIMLQESFKRAFYRGRYYHTLGKYFRKSTTPKWGKAKPGGFEYAYGRYLVMYMVGSALGAVFAIYFFLFVLFSSGK